MSVCVGQKVVISAINTFQNGTFAPGFERNYVSRSVRIPRRADREKIIIILKKKSVSNPPSIISRLIFGVKYGVQCGTQVKRNIHASLIIVTAGRAGFTSATRALLGEISGKGDGRSGAGAGAGTGRRNNIHVGAVPFK